METQLNSMNGIGEKECECFLAENKSDEELKVIENGDSFPKMSVSSHSQHQSMKLKDLQDSHEMKDSKEMKENQKENKQIKQPQLSKEEMKEKESKEIKRKKVSKENITHENNIVNIDEIENQIENQNENERKKINKIQSESFNPNTFGQNLNFNPTLLQREIKPFSIQNQKHNESNYLNCSYYGIQNNLYVPYQNGNAFVPV